MIKFGPSGNSQSFYDKGYKHSEQSAKFVKDMNLDCFEYSFGRGVNLGEEKAISIGDAFKENGVEISVHAPYYINLANTDDEMVQKSFNYLLQSGNAVKTLQGKRCVFHTATQGKLEREKAVELSLDKLKTFTDFVYLNNLQDITFCPETMGKLGQIGTIEEIVDFCLIDKIFTPCVDFGHINAREQGSLKSVFDYQSRLQYMMEKLGFERMKNFHVHFSKIMYSAKGEVKHLTFEDKTFGPEFEPLAIALKNLKLEPYIICESAGTQAEDAFIMKEIYNRN